MLKEEEIRIKKLQEITRKGINPYPSKCLRTHSIGEVVKEFASLSESGQLVTLAGRLRTIRIHGKASFSHLEDGTGKFQLYFKKDVLGELYDFFLNLIDIGDFIEASGTLFTTRRGEKTLLVQKFTLLAKSLLPLPEKWHGLTDIELRFRKRYLDLLANQKIREIFIKRSKIVRLIREFFDKNGFLEVETPILQPIPGGATARPFVTHHKALDMDLYLRIAPELYLKRLIVGGFEKVYEVARCFRNEGIDWAHNPEFTQVEFYWAYADYNDLMKLTENLMKFLLEKIENKLVINLGDKEIDFTPPYPKISYREALIKYAEIDLEKYETRERLLTKAKNLGLEVGENWSQGKILDEIFKELVRPKIINPTFIIDYPIELSPLAKKKSGNENYVERFQLVIKELEVCNAYSELNDPLDQEKRFKEQEMLRGKGEEEAQRFDEDFIEALKYGMPPTAGEGIGIDRLAAILCNVHSLKEIILFPTLRLK